MREIGAHTSIVGLIGWPVGHSISPQMHNAAFIDLGLDWLYLPFPVNSSPPERIGEAVLGLRALGFRGANVTVPHKQAVMAYLDMLTPAAEAIGAVNTIVLNEDGTLFGDNTDAQGFIADLADNEMNPYGRRILVLGAGGSARAIVFGLAEAQAASIHILNRTASRAEELAERMSMLFPKCRLGASSLAAGVTVADYDIVVNCTSVGMAPDVDDALLGNDTHFTDQQCIYDLIYNPSPTKLVQIARDYGAHAVNGQGMLVWQGALAFELWTGVQAPLDVMKTAIGMK